MKKYSMLVKGCILIISGIMFLCTCASIKQEPATLSLDPFIGNWANVDESTRGISKVEIRSESNKVYVHMWGACQPIDCEWGEISADMTPKSLKVKWVLSWVVEQQEVSILEDGNLRVVGHVHYTDQSGRKDRDYTEDFIKT